MSFYFTAIATRCDRPCNNQGSNCSGSFQLLAPIGGATSGETLFYATNATADYGILRASASAQTSTVTGSFPFPSIVPYNISGTILVTGAASFRDQWTITGGTAGTSGFMDLYFNMTGIFSATSAADAEVQFPGLDGPTNSLITLTSGANVSQLRYRLPLAQQETLDAGLGVYPPNGTGRCISVECQWIRLRHEYRGVAECGGAESGRGGDSLSACDGVGIGQFCQSGAVR